MGRLGVLLPTQRVPQPTLCADSKSVIYVPCRPEIVKLCRWSPAHQVDRIYRFPKTLSASLRVSSVCSSHGPTVFIFYYMCGYRDWAKNNPRLKKVKTEWKLRQHSAEGRQSSLLCHRPTSLHFRLRHSFLPQALTTSE